MPTVPGDQQQSRHFLPRRPQHSRSQSYQVPLGPQISPINSNEANANQSSSTPPSPSPYAGRQARPLYMPAVLRANDEFCPPRMLTKSKTSETSISDSDSDTTLRNSGFLGFTGLGAIGHRLNRRSTGERPKSFAGTLDLEGFQQVTALPTRRHWKVSFATPSAGVSMPQSTSLPS